MRFAFHRFSPVKNPIHATLWTLALGCLVWSLAGPVRALAQEAPAEQPAQPQAVETAPAPEPVAPAGPAATTPRDTQPAPAEKSPVPTLADLFMTSPYINSGIATLSVFALVIFLFLLLALTSRGFNPPRFFEDVTKLVNGKQFDQAVHLCQLNSGVFASSIIQRLVENRDKDHGVLMEIIQTEGRRRAEVIWNRVNYLAEIANIAPLLGLLGTVVGMIDVFYGALTVRIAGEKAQALASGIGGAMSTTMFGLIVAIAAGAFYALLRSRATGVLAESEQLCHTLADLTSRASADPRLKKIEALAEAARQKITLTGTRPTPHPTAVSTPGSTGFGTV